MKCELVSSGMAPALLLSKVSENTWRVVRQTGAAVFLGVDGSQNDENCKVVWLWYNYNPNVVGSVS